MNSQRPLVKNGIKITQIGVSGSGTEDCTQATNQDIVDEDLLLENGKSDCETVSCLIYDTWDTEYPDDNNRNEEDLSGYNPLPGKYGFNELLDANVSFIFKVINQQDQININIIKSDYEKISIELFDVNSNKVLTMNNINSSPNIEMNTSKLSNGVYFIRISSGNELIGKEKIIIVK